MSYESVLGYSNNFLIEKYQEKYLQKLLAYLKAQLGDIQEVQVFLGYEVTEQKDFLLHPDISSLLQSISLQNSPESKQKLLQELEYFLGNHKEKLTSSQGENIPGTSVKLTDVDNNPENSIINHPDHDQEGMMGWGEKSEKEWEEVFGKAFSLLRNVNSDFYDELNIMIKKIVPMKTSVDVHNSCSYKECVGTLYLGYTTNAKQAELNILEALIHESSHNKLNLIMQLEELHKNDYTLKYYSPYRPDARHIQGVLLGVHAIVPTVYVMLQAIEKDYIEDKIWLEKVILYHIKNKLGFRVLSKHASFTPIGKQIYDDMGAVIQLCDKKIQKNNLFVKVNIGEIQKRAKQHFLEVQQNYPHVQY